MGAINEEQEKEEHLHSETTDPFPSEMNHEPSLFLGRRGDVISVDEIRFIQSFRDAIHDGDDDKAKDVITKGAANVNKVIEGVHTSVLGLACKSDARCGIVKVLLEEFTADPNLDVDYPPLSRACKHGCKEIVKVLLQIGANPTQPDFGGTPPIALAALNSQIEIIQFNYCSTNHLLLCQT